MATADDALNVARSRLGAGPDEFWNWYGGSGYAWCCVFQSWVLSAVGIPTRYAWVSGLFDAMNQAGRGIDPHDAQPGDLIGFQYDAGWSLDHIAMVEAVVPDGLVCLNGNWTNRVCRVLHRWDASGYAGGISVAARPTYTTPQPPPQEDDDDMAKSVIIWDRAGAAWHCCGATRVALADIDEVNVLKFLGVPEVYPPNDGNQKWLSACAIIPRNGGIYTPGN